MASPLSRVGKVVKGLGSGLVAGASDNDPTSVATLSVIGSTTVYGLLWLVVLLLPMLALIQVISARVGVATRKSLQQVINTRYGPVWGWISLFLVAAVNLITLAADLEGGAAAVGLLVHVDWQYFVLPLAIVSGLLLVIGRYSSVQRILQVVLLIFIAYIAAGLLSHPKWGEVLGGTVIPQLKFDQNHIAGALALLGSTLTSYVYFWQSVEEEEERPPKRKLRNVEVNSFAGILFAVVIFWFIVVSSAATAGVSGQQIQTAEDAAKALKPVAGDLAEEVFAVGLLASSLLSLPVLAATTGYLVVQSIGQPGSVEQPLRRSTLPFYAVIAGSLAIGSAVTLLGIKPIDLLFVASLAGGIGTPLLLFLLFRAAGDQKVMGKYRVGGKVQIGGWLTVAVVSLASIGYVVTQVLGGS